MATLINVNSVIFRKVNNFKKVFEQEHLADRSNDTAYYVICMYVLVPPPPPDEL